MERVTCVRCGYACSPRLCVPGFRSLYDVYQPQRRYTLEEYLALERAAEVKYEYWQGEVFAIVSSPLTCGSRCQASHHTAYLKILAIFYGHGALMHTADLLNLGHYQGVDVYSWSGGVEF